MSKVTCLLMLGLIAWSQSATATTLNLDFGNAGGSVSSAYGAASGQTGSWNTITSFNTNSGIVDTNGTATGVTISINASTMGGNHTLPPGDGNSLMEDNFFSSPDTSWSLTIAGLDNGIYDIYLYDPSHPSVGTGSGTVNGAIFSDINSGAVFTGTFSEGQNFHYLSNVSIVGSLIGIATSSRYSGLAGLQLVQSSVPAPTVAVLFLIGITGIAFIRRRVS